MSDDVYEPDEIEVLEAQVEMEHGEEFLASLQARILLEHMDEAQAIELLRNADVLAAIPKAATRPMTDAEFEAWSTPRFVPLTDERWAMVKAKRPELTDADRPESVLYDPEGLPRPEVFVDDEDKS